jgi:hypothetical protein
MEKIKPDAGKICEEYGNEPVQVKDTNKLRKNGRNKENKNKK